MGASNWPGLVGGSMGASVPWACHTIRLVTRCNHCLSWADFNWPLTNTRPTEPLATSWYWPPRIEIASGWTVNSACIDWLGSAAKCSKRWFCQLNQPAKPTTHTNVTISVCRSRKHQTRKSHSPSNTAAIGCWLTNQLLSRPQLIAAKNNGRT